MFLLIISTLLSFLSVHTKIITNPVMHWMNRVSKEEKTKLNEIKALQCAQQKLSMVDNFVEYSKIQRKINKLTESLKESKSRNSNDFFLKIGIPYGLRIIIISMLIILCLYYRGSPLFYLESSINLFPFGYFISFPNGRNSVSFHFWVMCCTAFARLIKL
ncbi:guided entry of tail-anchored proteins factor 1 [Coccinella septempunctata]|uniref:guided entry of tail-anchored proteins factor 1 n=1 Tax=Coccinella septempunctata TaxID=41139 RepID=UPI001D08E78A|nr:guided entry of tail-anchored proteins factor 1 [Coccinella septempunctata]